METPPTPRVSWHYAAIFFIPGILWLLNPNWVFQNLGHMDPWYYFGAFRFFPRFHNLLPSYATERMTWIAPGYLFVRIFGQVAGVALLHCFFFLVCLYAAHSILRRLTDYRTAFLGAILLGTNPFFIGSHSQDYVQGISMASLLLALALVIRAWAAPSRRDAFVFLSAMAWAALVYSYFAWVAFTPLYLWMAVHLAGGKRVLALAAAGALATTLLLWAVYHAMGGTGTFLHETLTAAFHFSQLPITSLLASPTWFRQVVWIVVPALAAAIAAAWLAASRFGQDRVPKACAAALWFHLLCFVAMAILTLRNNPVLQVDFFSSVLTPTVFVALAITLWRVPETVRPWLFYPIAISGAVVCAAPLARLNLYRLLTHREFIVPAVLALVALGGYARWRQPGPLRWAVAVLLFAGLSFAFGPSFTGPAWSKPYNGRDVSERVSLAMNTIAGRLSSKQLPVFWIDNYDDPLGPEYRGVMCSFLMHSQSMWHYPALDAGKRYPAGTRLVLITPRKDVVAAASDVLRKAAMPVALVDQHLVDYGGISYWITQLDVVPSPAGEKQAQ